MRRAKSTAARPHAPAAAEIGAQEFERLECGDVLVSVAGDRALMVNQVRNPGQYVVVRVDAKTRERLAAAVEPSLLTSGAGFTLGKRE